MDWLFYAIVCVPLVFLPLLIYDIFTLPQTAFLALLSAVGVIGLGVRGMMVLNPPILLALMLIGYLAISTLWTEVQDGAKKEFAIQFPLLLVFILVIQCFELNAISILVVLYCASFLSQFYAFGQSLGIDFVFPYRLKQKSDDRRPIGTLGNINFLAGYILPSFWIGLYLAWAIHPVFLAGVLLTLFLFWRMKCRGAWLGLIGSVYVFSLLLFFGKYVRSGWYLGGVLLLGFWIAGSIAFWLKKNWDLINNEHIISSKNGKTKIATLRYRICYWWCGWRLFKKEIWRGHGLRSYRKLVYFEQAAINEEDPEFLNPKRYVTPQPRECHNDWLEDLVELGIIGTAIRWTLIGSILWYARLADPFILFSLAAMSSIAVHSMFFFGLRMPSTGMVFWLLGGLIILNSYVPVQLLGFSPWIALPLAAFFAVYLWEVIGKELLASWHFMQFAKSNNPVEKEGHCLKAARYCPKETIYNTHMLIGYLNVLPQQAYKWAEEMWFNYDGMTPGWVMYYNMGITSETIGSKEQAYRHYATSYRMLPTFADTAQRLGYLEPYIPLAQKGEIVKKVSEEARLNILLVKANADNLELQKQNIMAQGQNLILQEAGRLNIPQGWHYDFDGGVFLSPDELAARNEELQKQQMQQQSGLPGQQTTVPSGKESEDGRGK